MGRGTEVDAGAGLAVGLGFATGAGVWAESDEAESAKIKVVRSVAPRRRKMLKRMERLWRAGDGAEVM